MKATTNKPGTPLRAPTAEDGFVTACKDTCVANLTLQLWVKRYDGSKGKVNDYIYGSLSVCAWFGCVISKIIQVLKMVLLF